MLRILAHDTVNDITIIQTDFCFNVRYGLQVKKFDSLREAINDFKYCQLHAMSWLTED